MIAAHLGRWTAFLLAIVAATSFAIRVTTLPRSGPDCTGDCLAYPYLDAARYVPRGNETLDTHVHQVCYFYMDAPTTLQKAIAHFSDPENPFKAAVEFRWPGSNVTCPRCGGAKHPFIKTRRIWFC